MAQEVLDYISLEEDWLLTVKVDGEDASSEHYLKNPKRLCQVLAENMLALHQLVANDCPVQDKTAAYIKTVEKGYQQGRFDRNYLLSHQRWMTNSDAYKKVQEFSKDLDSNTLIHGDFCLPNVMLKDWQFQSFIGWDSAGLGDKHIDLYWILWSLRRNLGTDQFRDYFLDCYGKENVNLALLDAIACFEVFG